MPVIYTMIMDDGGYASDTVASADEAILKAASMDYPIVWMHEISEETQARVDALFAHNETIELAKLSLPRRGIKHERKTKT